MYEVVHFQGFPKKETILGTFSTQEAADRQAGISAITIAGETNHYWATQNQQGWWIIYHKQESLVMGRVVVRSVPAQ